MCCTERAHCVYARLLYIHHGHSINASLWGICAHPPAPGCYYFLRPARWNAPFPRSHKIIKNTYCIMRPRHSVSISFFCGKRHSAGILNILTCREAVREVEIQYDRAQKLTFLKLKRMSWDRVARAGNLVACSLAACFLQEDGGESITTCIFVLSHLLRCYIRKRCSNQTHGRVAGRAACGANRERNSTSCTNHIMSARVYMLSSERELGPRERGKKHTP